MKGKLITVEGIDGSGKSSLVQKLGERFKEETDKQVLLTKEPTDSWLGDSVREGLKREVDPLSEAFLFTADHIHHVRETIEPALKEGNIIISDRYSDSFYAYQGTTLQGELENPINYLTDLRKDFTIIPDITVLLDIDPETSVKRIKHDQIKFENKKFLKKVTEKYNSIANKDTNRFIRINANQEIDQITEKAFQLIKNQLDL
ncbi:Thymidylate kinase Tmk [Methanonatronarchaeum thermophilum]|uniref:Probable thymidylate kinase n=1 Tax=Methanonatronarchaeum thermophilum TaxID=1927129 RepID=A0A1Y3GBG9_9EURY|nr:dTMP kinase [Methanonatronarchaeum thermophilum]OUJ18802.1 Thymidylate kinase Tmk [Methanonatronarchaeum thermophilum]